MEEEYSAEYAEKTEVIESQEASDSPPLTFKPDTEEYGDIDEEQFKAWLKQKDDLSENVARVCRKYGQTLRKKVPMKEFMYDSEHDLLFCRNAKVCFLIYFENFYSILKNILSGWNNILAQQLFINFFKVSTSF